MISFLLSNSAPAPAPDRDNALRASAENLEATFLAEMLKSAGLGKTTGYFGGGAGEDQFSSFLVEEHARQLVRAGGVGLAETLFDTLKDRTNV